MILQLSEKQKRIQNKWKKLGIQIDKDLRDILHGYLASNGQVTASGSLFVQQSIKQRKFVNWLYEHLAILHTDTPIRIQNRLDTRWNTQLTVCEFQTRCILEGFHSMWYKKYKVGEKSRYIKRLPASLAYFFTPTFISVWFAGNGTKMIGQYGAKFEVTSYTPEDRLYLQQLFKQKFDINTKILRSGTSKVGKTQWNLCIPSSEYEKFRTLITQIDLIPRLFPHKLCKKKQA